MKINLHTIVILQRPLGKLHSTVLQPSFSDNFSLPKLQNRLSLQFSASSGAKIITNTVVCYLTEYLGD